MMFGVQTLGGSFDCLLSGDRKKERHEFPLPYFIYIAGKIIIHTLLFLSLFLFLALGVVSNSGHAVRLDLFIFILRAAKRVLSDDPAFRQLSVR